MLWHPVLDRYFPTLYTLLVISAMPSLRWPINIRLLAAICSQLSSSQRHRFPPCQVPINRSKYHRETFTLFRGPRWFIPYTCSYPTSSRDPSMRCTSPDEHPSSRHSLPRHLAVYGGQPKFLLFHLRQRLRLSRRWRLVVVANIPSPPIGCFSQKRISFDKSRAPQFS